MSATKATNFLSLTALAFAAFASSAGAHTPSTPSQAAPVSALPPKTQSALKLAGLVTFVANACPKLQPNYPRFEKAITALGVAKGELDKADMKAGYLGYAARYNTDVKGNCERADAQFGPQGKTLSGIFGPR
jgi:hypothetical protein